MKKQILIIPTFFLSIIFLSGQKAYRKKTYRKIITKETFIHTWTLSEIRNSANSKVTDKVEMKILKFTQDSIFITTVDTIFSGTWKLEKGQIQTFIKNSFNYNYKWFSMGSNIICFGQGDDFSKLECFMKKD